MAKKSETAEVDDVGGERVFTGRVQALNRVAIPSIIMENLDIKKGDAVEIRIRRVGRRNPFGYKHNGYTKKK